MVIDAKIQDFGDIITGKTPSTSNTSYWGCHYPFITPSDYGFNDRYIYTTDRQISIQGANSQKKTILPKNSICITCIGSTIGKICMTVKPSITNQQINSIICNENYDSYYVFYLLKYCIPFLQMYGSGTGSGVPIISKNKFGKIKLTAESSLPLQRRIASILSAYDNLIEANSRRIKILEQMAENLYKEWFVRFRFPNYQNTPIENGIPKGWKVERLKDFGITLTSGSRPKGGIDANLEEGVPSLGAESIKGLAEFDYSSVKLVPQEFYCQMKRGKNTGNDILLYKDGAYIGKTTLFRDGFPFKTYSINEHVFIISPIDQEYKNYLYFTLHQEAFFYLMQNLNRNAAQPGLSNNDINNIKVMIPNKELIAQYNLHVEPILKEIFKLAHQSANLTRQRDLLLPRLMSGQLTPLTNQ